MMLAVQHVWHYWLALPLALTAILLGIALVIGYLRTVVKPRYPGSRD